MSEIHEKSESRLSEFLDGTLEAAEREAVERHLDDVGIHITETVKLHDGTVFFFVRDPDGNVIEFHQPA